MSETRVIPIHPVWRPLARLTTPDVVCTVKAATASGWLAYSDEGALST